jgi:predicted dithiol-disulfide oxidoreductase (DUF899 family)
MFAPGTEHVCEGCSLCTDRRTGSTLAGRPQSEPYTSWRLHDDYDKESA